MKDHRDDIEDLEAILQRLADREGQTYLLLVATSPRRRCRIGSPYGVPADQADPWEQRNAARRIVPRGKQEG